ncbi:hypothetical protein D9M68_553010 [compost metagenome]
MPLYRSFTTKESVVSVGSASVPFPFLQPEKVMKIKALKQIRNKSALPENVKRLSIGIDQK